MWFIILLAAVVLVFLAWRFLFALGAFVAYVLTWAALGFIATMVYRAIGG